MRELCVTSRSVSVLLDPEGLYEAREKRELFLDGERIGEEYRSVASLFDLEPDTEYTLESVTEKGTREKLAFRTRRETCTLDVRRFGARGDGETDDTAMLQVADQGGREGNYLESSGSSMIACGMLKGVRLGILGPEYASAARKTFGTLSGRLAWKDGKPELGGICLVAGLGPEDNRRRDGSFEYYISEPVVANDAKGIAPFVLCYTELRRAGK